MCTVWCKKNPIGVFKRKCHLLVTCTFHEPTEKDFGGWGFVHPHRPVPCAGAVKYWFESQTKLKCILWPHAAEDLLPMKNVWCDLLYELNMRILSDIPMDCLWTQI